MPNLDFGCTDIMDVDSPKLLVKDKKIAIPKFKRDFDETIGTVSLKINDEKGFGLEEKQMSINVGAAIQNEEKFNELFERLERLTKDVEGLKRSDERKDDKIGHKKTNKKDFTGAVTSLKRQKSIKQ